MTIKVTIENNGLHKVKITKQSFSVLDNEWTSGKHDEEIIHDNSSRSINVWVQQRVIIEELAEEID